MRLRMFMPIILSVLLLCASNAALYAEQVVSDAELSVLVSEKGPAWQQLDRSRKEALVKQISENYAKNTTGEAILKTVPESVDAIDAYYARGGEAMNDSLATVFHAVNVGDLKRRFASGDVAIKIGPDDSASIVTRDKKQVIMGPNELKGVKEKFLAKQKEAVGGAVSTVADAKIDALIQATGNDWVAFDIATKELVVSAFQDRCAKTYPKFRKKNTAQFIKETDQYLEKKNKDAKIGEILLDLAAGDSYIFCSKGIFIRKIDSTAVPSESQAKVTITPGAHTIYIRYSDYIRFTEKDYPFAITIDKFQSYLLIAHHRLGGRYWKPEIIPVNESSLQEANYEELPPGYVYYEKLR